MEARCGPVERQRLQRSDVIHSYVQLVGVLEDGRIVCSSAGQTPARIGPPDLVTSNGYDQWLNLRLPFAAEERFIGIGNGKFIAVVHKALPVDTTIPRHVSLAIISLAGQRVLSSRRHFERRWMPRREELKPGGHRTVLIGDRLIAQVRSDTMDLAAVAALDEADYQQELASATWLLAPIGMGGGFLLAWLLWRVAATQMSLPAAIRSGLRRREFFPLFQPIVRLADQRVVGAEALIRWRRSDGQLVAPDRFIGAAEGAGLIGLVTAEMFRMVEKTLAVLARHQDTPYLSLNLSPGDFHSDDTEQRLHTLLARSGASASQVVLEITERGFADIGHARVVVNRLRGQGFRVSIDDFGTGYSSLSDLVRLDVDTIKIDKAFVDSIDAVAATNHIAAHIVEMAHGMSLGMVAEGIERGSQVQVLRSWGVEYGQGYFFAQPMSGDDFLALVHAQTPRAAACERAPSVLGELRDEA
ncbi:EAL domain-containing protein [Agrilutibacter solisilvae]|uniref:cyclic-guanylate-specific phosphodiesterase n=1 Tax=Agrilutibacter solisilvae TaxID=2763317 RepID=A0A974XZJ7_9GAMM|nr:EAL domain-containing protein [Lysobacter solisilvae]QSX78677.1 EAL domain-containing protein [Lysobacter solisilvae]